MATLEEEINAAGGPSRLLRSGRSGPIRAEFTNWRDEQESWRTTAALMDLSHHMTDLQLEGPGTYRLLRDVGANIAMIDEDKLTYGDQVELVWGEPDGGSANPAVERHSQTTIRATVTARPFPAEK